MTDFSPDIWERADRVLDFDELDIGFAYYSLADDDSVARAEAQLTDGEQASIELAFDSDEIYGRLEDTYLDIVETHENMHALIQAVRWNYYEPIGISHTSYGRTGGLAAGQIAMLHVVNDVLDRQVVDLRTQQLLDLYDTVPNEQISDFVFEMATKRLMRSPPGLVQLMRDFGESVHDSLERPPRTFSEDFLVGAFFQLHVMQLARAQEVAEIDDSYAYYQQRLEEETLRRWSAAKLFMPSNHDEDGYPVTR